MTLFTKVPGLYRTREGKHVWVKMVIDVTEYPVIGCKAAITIDGEAMWDHNTMHAYTITGRCYAGKDQPEDIVCLATDKQVILVFKPGHPDHTKPCLCRRDGHYNVLWRNLDAWWDTKGSLFYPGDDLELAELP